jgi:hypothetical protein
MGVRHLINAAPAAITTFNSELSLVILSFGERQGEGREQGGYFARIYFGSMTLSPLI